MTTLKDFCEAIDYKITGGSEYTWNCFGPNARYLDCNQSEYSSAEYSANAIFDSVTQTVYSIEAWDYNTNREYRWINPDYREAFYKECKKNNIDPEESIDSNKYIECEVTEDILEKINALVNNLEYDTRIKIPIDFSDKELLKYMKLAHELDITFNDLMERAVREASNEFRDDPKAFKKKVKKFKKWLKNENSSSQ